MINNWNKSRHGLIERDEPNDLMRWWPEGNTMVLLNPEDARQRWEELLGQTIEKTIEGLGKWQN